MPESNDRHPLNRRRFLRGIALAAGGSVLAACGAAPAAPAATNAPADAATSVPAATGATSAPAVTEATSAPAVTTSRTKLVIMIEPAELNDEAQQQLMTAIPDVEIELVKSDLTRYYSMAAAGTPPDILRVQAPDVPQLLSRDILLDLSPYFASSAVLKIDDLAPANNYYKANSPTEIGSGNIYGMTKDWSPDFTLFANKKAFAEANVPLPSTTEPMTYAQLAEIGTKLTKKEGDRTLRWGLGFFNELTDRIVMNILAEQDQRLYTDDFSRIRLTDNPPAQEALRYFFDLAKAGVIASPVNPSPSWTGDDFTKGTVAIAQYGYWFQAMAESDETKGEVVMLPAPTWSGKRLNPTMTATGLVVSRATKSPDLAWKVFEWYMGGQPALDRFASGWGVPSLNSKLDLLPSTTDFHKQTRMVLDGELPYAEQPLQFNPYINGGTFNTVWTKHFESALRDQTTFEQLLQNVETDMNAAIQDGKDQLG